MKTTDEKPSSRNIYNLTTRQVGKRTAESHQCSKDGCKGIRLVVQWPSGGKTHQCTSTMVYQQKAFISKAPYRGAVDIAVEAGSWVIQERVPLGCGVSQGDQPTLLEESLDETYVGDGGS